MQKITLYQVLPRLFGNTISGNVVFGSRAQNGCGKLTDFSPTVLVHLKALGISHIWYTGIIEHARCEGNPEYGIAAGNPRIIKGRAGSPYAITDYYDVNPDLATDIPNRLTEFKQLVTRTHEAGMKVIIDFVPNHVARQYHSDVKPETDFGINDDKTVAFSPRNDFYYLPGQHLQLTPQMGTVLPSDTMADYTEHPAKVTGNDCFTATPGVNDWYETVKLNYGIDYQNGHTPHFDPIPPLWDKMVDILVYWANMGVDGFRCDMAEMVPVAFWQYAIGRMKQQFNQIIFIAEVYNPALYRDYIFTGKFDYLYDKVGLYDTLRGVLAHEKSATGITQCWQLLSDLNAHMLRFLENHDEQRVASEQFAGNAEKGIPAFVVSALMHGGPVMLYAGQEFAEPAKGRTGYSGDDGRTTIFDYSYLPTLQRWYHQGQPDAVLLPENTALLYQTYAKILNLALSEPVFSQGHFYDLMWDNRHDKGPNMHKVYAFARYIPQSMAIVVTNFNFQGPESFLLSIPEPLLTETLGNAQNTIAVKGLLGYNQQFIVQRQVLSSKGLWLNLPAGGAFVITLSAG